MSAFALYRISDRLRATALSNSAEQNELFEDIRELRTSGAGEFGPEVLRRLEAASMLVGYLARMGELAGEDVRAIALQLLRDAAEGMRSPAGVPKGPIGRPQTVRSAKAERDTEPATQLLGDMMLGQILLKRGHILDEHVHQALKVQRSTSQRLGEILVRLGACSAGQVAEALAHQAVMRRVHNNPGLAAARRAMDQSETLGTGLKMVGEVMLGELLIQRNVITRRQLERALEVQKKEGLRIGEALVKIGATTMEQIEQALRIQGRDRRFGIKGSGEGPPKY